QQHWEHILLSKAPSLVSWQLRPSGRWLRGNQKTGYTTLFEPMNPVTSDATDAPGPSQLTRRAFEQFAAPEGLYTGAKRTRLLRAALLLAVVIAMGFGFWNVSRRLAPQLITSPTAPDENPALL